MSVSTTSADVPAPSDHHSDPSAVLEGPAYPPLLRVLAVVVVVGLLGAGVWSLPALRAVEWSSPSLLVFSLAAGLMGWVAWWMVYSHTRLEGTALLQTWLWDKRVQAHEVATFKLVHWRRLEWLVAPRLLVRKRNGAIAWFYCADVAVLYAFAQKVVQQGH